MNVGGQSKYSDGFGPKITGITALIAAVVLKEELALYHLVGGLLTLGGVILSERWTTPVTNC